VLVAPIHNDAGEVIGGVETFRDASALVHDLERAQAIQKMAMEEDLPEDASSYFTTHYISKDIIGGDYYAIKNLGNDLYGLILADVMGHGIAGALYTMHLSSLWYRYCEMLRTPAEFAARVNKELVQVVKGEVCYATAICGLVDLKNFLFRFVSAGGPHPVLIHPDGAYKCLESSGMPFALSADAVYEEISTPVHHGDGLLLFSDGAMEVTNAEGKMLDTQGLVEIIKGQGYPRKPIQMDKLEEELLKYSNAIRLGDDLTLLEVRFDESRRGAKIY
jgi:serine phosphatase RsbU (regulator of sigma subunit)